MEKVRFESCAKNARGHIDSAHIKGEVREMLPSLLDALRVANEKLGLDDKSELAYVHDWTKNTMQAKAEYELSL